MVSSYRLFLTRPCLLVATAEAAHRIQFWEKQKKGEKEKTSKKKREGKDKGSISYLRDKIKQNHSYLNYYSMQWHRADRSNNCKTHIEKEKKKWGWRG